MNSLRSLAVFIAALALLSSPALAQVSVSINIAPPPLVVEDQPVCPDDGDLWTPGYWAYDQDAGEYYWVPGAWVQPPEVGLLWTPAYWGWDGNDYVFYSGYWGPTVGFYGGVNYGHGYWGNGYGGGRWDGGHFSYNTAANNVVKGRVHSTYADRSAVRSSSSRVSYNGGKGGISARPTAQERQVTQHIQATPQQQSHFQAAGQTRTHQVKVNGAKPGASASATGVPPAPRKTGTQPESRPQPGAQPSTGGQAPAQNRAPMTDRTPVPTERQPAAATGVPPTTERRTGQPSERPAPESRPAQESGKASKPEIKPAPSQSAPHSKPAPKEEGKKPESQSQGESQGQPQGQPQGQERHP